MPVTEVIYAALWDCGHSELQKQTGTLTSVGGPEKCRVCDVTGVFFTFGQTILPVLQATCLAEIAAAGFCWEVIDKEGEVTGHEFDYIEFNGVTHQWGKLLEQAFKGLGDNKSIISDYLHTIIEHVAYLITVSGPLGYWSQQAIEAAHKVVKEAWSRSSAHDGGRPGQKDKSISQILKKSGRVLIAKVRAAAKSSAVVGGGKKKLVSKTARQLAWSAVVTQELGMSTAEQLRSVGAHNRTVRRVQRKLVASFTETPVARALVEEEESVQEVEEDSDEGYRAVQGSQEEDDVDVHEELNWS